MRPLTDDESVVLKDALSAYLDIDSPDEAEEMAEWLSIARELQSSVDSMMIDR